MAPRSNGTYIIPIIECNAKLKMKTFWPIYEDDIEYEGFTGKEDYLALIPP